MSQHELELEMWDAMSGPCPKEQSVVVTVVDESKARLDRQAVIKLHSRRTNRDGWQATSEKSELTFCNLAMGEFDVEASAAGYLSAQETLMVTGFSEGRLEIVLHRDPAALDLNENVDALPANARKEANHAIYDLKSGKLPEAQKRLDRIYKRAPSNPQLNYLFGYLYLQEHDLGQAETYLTRSANLDSRRAPTLTLLGRVQLLQNHYDDAQKALEQAVDADSSFWMAHTLLADAYLHGKQYEKAQRQAQIALDESKNDRRNSKGKNDSAVAQLVLGQAMIAQGHRPEGIQVLKSFLQANADNSVKPEVEEVIADAEKAETDSSASSAHPQDLTDDLALAASSAMLPTDRWAPPKVDDTKPSLATGVACPTETVLNKSGQRTQQLVDDIARFSAIESMEHDRLDGAGNLTSRETRKFDYVADITQLQPGLLTTEEFRNSRTGVFEMPDHIATVGFMSLALIFHPEIRKYYDMTCEGLGEWHGQATWLVYFRQRDKTAPFAEYRNHGESWPMKLKGRAWITADNFQIVHIESDLATPLAELSAEHQIVDYGPVHFARKNIDLWLPQTVDIFLELNRHNYHRRHSFDHFMLFSVDSDSKPKSPVTMNRMDHKQDQIP
jgi:tetratricopeptide (TPR) repeat protein